MSPSDATGSPLPERIGRYRVERLLGKGGFGRVYLAHDEQLERRVAVKVPHAELVSGPRHAELYLAEARTVAKLDHPRIVPVHDVGSTDAFPCFIVSKYIEGADLATSLKQKRPTVAEAADLTATIAEALHYAHRHGVVHRDIKPGNILLDRDGQPFVVDFGLALRDKDLGKGPRYAGTPAYMSPEQARGEGHRVDGRSDIFGLGVVLYEMLVGSRPFQGATSDEVLEGIATIEPKPPRQVDDRIPKELERICLKALAKRATERYTTALDLADDLRHFLSEATPVVSESRRLTGGSGVAVESRGPAGTSTDSPAPDSHPLKIVPKGLRSFDEHDADFFLELLPGPRDREGLPDSIRFWKTRIEETDADKTFAVGLIYGPSGCGKSSLVKAGLLPRLSANVTVVYLEATAAETEIRLLKRLQKQCPALPADLNVRESIAALRRGEGVPAGGKVLIVLDQFEQWLHSAEQEKSTELVDALRQCDGARVQCLVMVRDDFWLAIGRFMRELEIPLIEGQNSALVDIFDIDHARRVLAAFGRAFGRLPENQPEASRDQKAFLNEAVAGLAKLGKAIPVRLALFAEMMKGKPWEPATLKAMGGMEGVGVAFLEDVLGPATAAPTHRYHHNAARAVLKALLPDSGSEIRGHLRSHTELLAASGYASRLGDFDELIRILDSEIRLITPTDPEGAEIEVESAHRMAPQEKYYQLTHDYLVPALRDWLTRGQKGTRRGRAELLLAERAAVWNASPQSRNLPSLSEYLRIRSLTSPQSQTPAQRAMMRAAGRYHVPRLGALTLLAAGLFVLSAHIVSRVERDSIITRLNNVWTGEMLDDARKRAVESDLERLAKIDPNAADDQRAAYIGALLRLPNADLDSLERTVVALRARGEGALARLRSPLQAHMALFSEQFAPENRFDKVDYYERPDARRLIDLPRVADLEEDFGIKSGSPGVRVILLRVYMAADDTSKAWEVAQKLLDRPDLLPAWRLIVFRDLVWVAIGSHDNFLRSLALSRLNQCRSEGGDFRPEYLELAVEKARLLNADGDPDEAARVLDGYLADSRRQLDLKPSSMLTFNSRFVDGPKFVNVPVLFYLEAALLRGFLPGSDDSVWKAGFKTVEGHRTASSYEAAVLGSLGDCLKNTDVAGMMTETAETATTFSPVMGKLLEFASDPKGLDIATEIIRRSWQTERGRSMARQIAMRDLPFSAFIHAQLRLWVYEGLRILARGRGAELSDEDDRIFWGIAEDFQREQAAGRLRELRLTELVDLVDPATPETNAELAQWRDLAKTLSPRLQAPLAYVLGRKLSPQLGKEAMEARKQSYFEYALQHAESAPDPKALRKAIESDSAPGDVDSSGPAP